MRERSQTTPRRRGPKMPLPRDIYDDQYDPPPTESPYYTIDNTEDIYGTTLLPSQRCYVDPWDLENYDYVRKKINSKPSSPSGYYETSLSPSPAGKPISTKYYYMPKSTPPPAELVTPRMAATMPRDRRNRSNSHYHCQMECCNPRIIDDSGFQNNLPRRRYDDSGIYDRQQGHYDDYMMQMSENMQREDKDMEQNIYTGYGGFSSSSSTEHHSSIEDESVSPMLLQSPVYESHTTGRIGRRGPAVQRNIVPRKHSPKINFPAPPSMHPSSIYDYCNPYATLPYCSIPDCYECLSQAPTSSLIYAAPSMYGSSTSYYGVLGATNSSTLGRRPSSSLYSGIYANKFGLSKKGMLQIDYSCSWNDLDRVIRRNY